MGRAGGSSHLSFHSLLAAVDIDNLLCRQTLDVIGQAGFGIDFRAVQVLVLDFAMCWLLLFAFYCLVLGGIDFRAVQVRLHCFLASVRPMAHAGWDTAGQPLSWQPCFHSVATPASLRCCLPAGLWR